MPRQTGTERQPPPLTSHNGPVCLLPGKLWRCALDSRESRVQNFKTIRLLLLSDFRFYSPGSWVINHCDAEATQTKCHWNRLAVDIFISDDNGNAETKPTPSAAPRVCRILETGRAVKRRSVSGGIFTLCGIPGGSGAVVGHTSGGKCGAEEEGASCGACSTWLSNCLAPLQKQVFLNP